MNEKDQISDDVRPNRLIAWLVGGLPLGLIVMGALSFVIWFNKKKEQPPAVSEFAAMLRRDVNSTDFERYRRLITEEIGGSSMTEGEKREAVAVFVESSMGMDNMGYEMLRKTYEGDASAIYGELPGKSGSGAVVLVMTEGNEAYRNEEQAACLAALMTVAHALTGTQHTRTVRFASVSGEQAKNELSQDAAVIIRLIGSPAAGNMAKEQTFVVAGVKSEWLGMLQSLQRAVESAAGR